MTQARMVVGKRIGPEALNPGRQYGNEEYRWREEVRVSCGYAVSCGYRRGIGPEALNPNRQIKPGAPPELTEQSKGLKTREKRNNSPTQQSNNLLNLHQQPQIYPPPRQSVGHGILLLEDGLDPGVSGLIADVHHIVDLQAEVGGAGEAQR